MASSFGGQCSCAAEKFSAHQEMCPPALPKFFFSAHQEIRLKVSSISGGSGSARPKNFGSAETMLSDFSPNKFGRSKIRHQFPCPLSHASHSLKPVAWTEKS
jgi:hypothetical protein